MAALKPGDIVVVTKLDRLGRSTRELLDLIDSIGKAGASFRSERRQVRPQAQAVRIPAQRSNQAPRGWRNAGLDRKTYGVAVSMISRL
jgi:DNA invertase Pin-like site-specific DNA recombinase